MDRPAIVDDAHQRATKLGFQFSCDDGTGRLLAVLAAAVPESGRILEIGTGTGAGVAWMVHGLGDRTDVRIVSIESDAPVAEAAATASWPSYVELRTGDAMDELAGLGTFDLIFPDAPAGKWTGLRRTLAALRPRGLLVVDDMAPKDSQPAEWNEYLQRTRDKLLSDPELMSVEIADLTGVILSVKTSA